MHFLQSLSAMILFMYFMHFMCLYVIYIVIIVIIIINIFGIMHLFFVSHGRFFGPPEHRFPKFGCTWGGWVGGSPSWDGVRPVEWEPSKRVSTSRVLPAPWVGDLLPDLQSERIPASELFKVSKVF